MVNQDLRQSKKYAEYMRGCGWTVEKVISLKEEANNTSGKKRGWIYLYIKKIPTLPLSIMKLQRCGFIPDFKRVKKIIKKYHIFSVTLEPGLMSDHSTKKLEELVKNNGFRKEGWPFLPTKTVQIDLGRNEDKLLLSMQPRTRTYIRKSLKQCRVIVLTGKNVKSLKKFYDFWKKNGKGYVPSLNKFSLFFKVFDNDAFVVTAKQNENFISGILVLLSGNVAYYFGAVTSNEGRTQLGGYATVWKAILETKKRGCKTFDFEGIYDERYPKLKRWSGFSEFKRKFGEKEVVFPPAYHRFYFPY